MKYIDFGVQIILILTGIVWSIFSPEGEFLHTLMVIQIFLGIWQLASLVITISVEATFLKVRRTISLIFLGYIILWMALLSGNLQMMLNVKLSARMFELLTVIPSWSLAIFYCYISYHTAFPKSEKHTGNFLRHISF